MTKAKTPKRLSENARNATIDRAEFDAVMGKLLNTGPPITKQEIAARVKRVGHVSRVGKRSDQR
jgi:hypothetical protein